ncbi:alpha/beta hydrolase [Afifella pfennigii]|uniref:alpha/beta hydrolase n=1 Tax=Afifella pfennigii TaxID=209897 RepID=UPI00047C0EB4|nr:alpha/beta hydrolase [Afifella pfennigii]
MRDLVAIPHNPVPPGARTAMIATPDGKELRAAWWGPDAPARQGTVVLLQGRAEFIEKYFETVQDLRRRGFGVVAFDWRGQGGSTRSLRDARKGHVDDFSEYLVDLSTIMDELALARCAPPFHILAHSTGAAVALLYAARARTQVERMVLTAPLLGLAFGHTATLSRLTGLINYLGLGEVYAGPDRGRLVQLAPFENNPVTSDRRRYERNQAVIDNSPSLGLSGPTFAWLHSALRAAEYIAAPGFAERVPLPVLIAFAGRESVVSNAAIEAFALRTKTVASVRIVGAKHELLQEASRFRDDFWAAFDAFIGDTAQRWSAALQT